jgi:hypothetical protein
MQSRGVHEDEERTESFGKTVPLFPYKGMLPSSTIFSRDGLSPRVSLLNRRQPTAQGKDII